MEAVVEAEAVAVPDDETVTEGVADVVGVIVELAEGELDMEVVRDAVAAAVELAVDVMVCEGVTQSSTKVWPVTLLELQLTPSPQPVVSSVSLT